MKEYKISLSLLQSIVDYLQKQPWSDVNTIMLNIQVLVSEQDAKTKEVGTTESDSGTPIPV